MDGTVRHAVNIRRAVFGGIMWAANGGFMASKNWVRAVTAAAAVGLLIPVAVIGQSTGGGAPGGTGGTTGGSTGGSGGTPGRTTTNTPSPSSTTNPNNTPSTTNIQIGRAHV